MLDVLNPRRFAKYMLVRLLRSIGQANTAPGPMIVLRKRMAVVNQQ